MSLFRNPQPLDIFVTLIIGIAVGTLITTLYFYLVIKAKWEKAWGYRRIKTMSHIRLPQIPVDDATLSRTEIQGRMTENISITDESVLQSMLAQDRKENHESKKHTSNDSYFFPSLGQPRNITFGATLLDDQDIQKKLKGKQPEYDL